MSFKQKEQAIKDFIFSMSLDPKEIFIIIFKLACEICCELGWDFPWHYSKGVEYMMAIRLGHEPNPGSHGADAITTSGKEAEYKSTTTNRIIATFNGISYKETPEEMEKYLREEKFPFETYTCQVDPKTGSVEQMYQLTGEIICDALIPKVMKAYNDESTKVKADARPGTRLNQGEIIKYGIDITDKLLY